MKRLLLAVCLLLSTNAAAYTRQDTLRGTSGPGRRWWDVLKYELTVEIDTATRTIRGTNRMTYRVIGKPDAMQIDLQEGMNLTSVSQGSNALMTMREGNVYWISGLPMHAEPGDVYTLEMGFSGKPRQAVNPPWDGGFIWTKDSIGKPWISVACQGLGASSWWPCKDYQEDEPDSGMHISIVGGKPSEIVSNGRFKDYISIDTIEQVDPITERTKYVLSRSPRKYWQVRNPINTYNTAFYIGDYVHWKDTFQGEKGVLDLDFYPLSYNLEKSMKQWRQAKEMLRCFEYWMGPYPFYEDGYKVVEAPFLGMEHQSAVAYGNGYKNGYRNPDGSYRDRSGTGVGFSFDFIIIHESGHEWFGNNITARDIADNWLHEGFTTYTETLFAEWIKGKDSAFAYVTGQQKKIRNDRPVIGDYGVNDDGSSDKYDKGAQVVHMIRLMIDDDKKFRELLRGLNKDFYHKTVTSQEVKDYISNKTGLPLSAFFNVYLRSTIKPVLQWYFEQGELRYKWMNTPEGFVAPFRLTAGKKTGFRTTEPVPAKISLPELRRNDIRVEAAGWYDVVEKK